MPRLATADETVRAEFLQADAPATQSEKPIIPAVIVYLGSKPMCSIPMRGRVYTETTEMESAVTEDIEQEVEPAVTKTVGGKTTIVTPAVTKTVQRIVTPAVTITTKKIGDTSAGMTAYAFERIDAFGRIIQSRIMPDSAPPDVRGRPFCRCEHPDHLVQFHFYKEHKNGPNEFRVLFAGDDGADPETRRIQALTRKAAFEEYLARATRHDARAAAELRETTG